MKKIILPLNKRLTKSLIRNRILLGLTGFQITQQNSLSGEQIEEEIQERKRGIVDLSVRV